MLTLFYQLYRSSQLFLGRRKYWRARLGFWWRWWPAGLQQVRCYLLSVGFVMSVGSSKRSHASNPFCQETGRTCRTYISARNSPSKHSSLYPASITAASSSSSGYSAEWSWSASAFGWPSAILVLQTRSPVAWQPWMRPAS